MPHSSPRLFLTLTLAIATLAALFLSQSARAASGTWTANAAGVWSGTGNWSGGTVASGAGFTADFSTIDITAGRTVTIDGAVASRTIGTLLIGDTGGASESAYSIAANGSGTLTFNNSGAGAVLTQTANTGSNIFNNTVPIILGDNLTINNNAATASTARSLTISGGITGAFNLTLNSNGTNSNAIALDTTNINNGGTITNSGTGTGTVTISSGIGTSVTGLAQSSATSQLTLSGGITLGTDMTLTSTGTKLTLISGIISGAHSFTIGGNGTGTTTLSGNNTFSNGLTLTNGTVNLNAAGTSATNSAVGTGTFVINGGTIENTSGGAISLATTTNNAQTWGGDFTVAAGAGTNNLNFGTGAITLTGNRQIQVTGTTSTVTEGGAIGDGGSGFSLTKNGPGAGTLILTGTSTYSGGTTIGSGIISVSSLGNAGASGNLGKGSVSIGSAAITANLIYTGAGETTNKVFNLSGTTGGAIIDTTGATGGLILSADLTATGAGTKTLTLRGNTTGNEVSGKIVDNLTGTNNTNLLKSQAGTWTFSGANTYTGTTSVTGGTLLVNGNQSSATGAVSVTGSSVLGGMGTIGGGTTIGGATAGTVTGGTLGGIDTLSWSNQTLNVAANGTYQVDIGGTASDLLALGGTGILNVTSGATLFFNQTSSLTGTLYTLATYGSDTGAFQSSTIPNGYSLVDTGTALELVQLTQVPEPSTWIAGSLVALALLATQRRRLLKPAALRA